MRGPHVLFDRPERSEPHQKRENIGKTTNLIDGKELKTVIGEIIYRVGNAEEAVFENDWGAIVPLSNQAHDCSGGARVR
jgi:hypothetical protein